MTEKTFQKYLDESMSVKVISKHYIEKHGKAPGGSDLKEKGKWKIGLGGPALNGAIEGEDFIKHEGPYLTAINKARRMAYGRGHDSIHIMAS